MQIGVLATNGGKHSNEKLAIAVATDIVNIGANASGEQAIDARKLENKIVEVMEVLFAKLADFEHGQIAAKGTLHLASSLDAHPELKEEAVKAILAEIKASPFASWFSAEAAESYVSASIDKWLKVGHHMHRDWFAAHGKVGNGTDLI
jgi:hypothetical protein